MSVSPTTTSIYTIPFPSLAFCNVNNIRKSSALQIEKSGTAEEKLMMMDLCGENNTNINVKDIVYDNDRTRIRKFVANVSQRCSAMVKSCWWKGVDINPCNDLFEPDMTDEGLCCVFNRLRGDYIYRHWPNHLQLDRSRDSVPWSPERGFTEDDPEDFKPWRTIGSGTHNGFKLILDTEIDEYYCTPALSVGIKVNAHSPVESPQISSHSILVSPGHESRIGLLPKLITASNQIKTFSVEKRNCYFSNEKRLRFFKLYTEANCMRECLTNFTLDECKCVLWFMPGGPDVPICNRIQEPCLEIAREKMYNDIRGKRSEEGNYDVNAEPCQCLPNCFEISYGMSVSANPIVSENILRRLSPSVLGNFNTTYFKKNMVALQIFFSNSHFTPYERGILFGFTDLIANTGGLLGLFMGFSILSLVEMAYFVAMKLFCASRNKYDSKNSADKKIKSGDGDGKTRSIQSGQQSVKSSKLNNLSIIKLNANDFSPKIK